MKTKFFIGLLVFSTCLSLSAFAQSKLRGAAGKASKVGVTTPAKTSGTKAKSPVTKQKSTPATPVRRVTANGLNYAKKGYMEIVGLSFANIDINGTIIDDFGSKLYAQEIRYLQPRIFYNGLSNFQKEITLNVKIYDEDGNLKAGLLSPEGFTYNKEVQVESGNGNYLLLSGWGSSQGKTYTPGLYKVEIWYQNKLLHQDEVRLYSGITPIVRSDIFSISGVTFANYNKEGQVISDYGQPLLDGSVKFLTPRIYYSGKYANNQDVTLYFRYFNSSGELVSGTSSPIGFSFKRDVTIRPGVNSVELSGFGNEAASSYREGVCKVEIWLDGEKIYETEVTINKADSSANPSFGSSTSIDDFFPIWGMTLGKTTWKEAEDAGNQVRVWENGVGRVVDVHNVSFWDHEGSGKFTSIYWTYYESEFPILWSSKGFSWDNSYDEWLQTFKNLGFTLKINKTPVTKEYDGRNTLSAEFEATSKDGMLQFDLDFDYGKDGHYTSSPKSLYSITIRYQDN